MITFFEGLLVNILSRGRTPNEKLIDRSSKASFYYGLKCGISADKLKGGLFKPGGLDLSQSCLD